MSLYREYRPKTFGDVVGQDHVVETLAQAAKQGKMSHAYLLSGPRGTGKTTIARILARTLLTAGIEDKTLAKQIDTSIDDGSLVDLMEIDAASNRGIDDIRSLLEKLQFAPVVCKAKVHIIDEVHMLSKDAFNALLKTLEEPPSYAYFILATTELHKVPATIQSRCQRFAFRQIPEEEIIQRLQFVASKEHIVIDRPALRAIAHRSDGIMRDALALLDQLRSLPSITVEEIDARTGESGKELADALCDAVEAGDEALILATVARVEERALPFDQILRHMLRRIRSGLHAAIAEGASTDEHLLRMNAVLDALKDLRTAPVPALTAEAALLSMLHPVMAKAAPTVAQTPIAPPISRQAAPPVPPPAAAKAKEESIPAPASIEAEELSLDAIRGRWDAVLKAVDVPSVRMSLKDATLQSLEGLHLTLAFSSNFHRSKVEAVDASRAIEGVLEEFFQYAIRLRCVLEAQEKGVPASDPELVNLAEAASEIF